MRGSRVTPSACKRLPRRLHLFPTGAWQPCHSLASFLVDWRLLGDKGQRLGTATFVYLIAGDASIEVCCHLQLQVRPWPLMTADDG